MMNRDPCSPNDVNNNTGNHDDDDGTCQHPHTAATTSSPSHDDHVQMASVIATAHVHTDGGINTVVPTSTRVPIPGPGEDTLPAAAMMTMALESSILPAVPTTAMAYPTASTARIPAQSPTQSFSLSSSSSPSQDAAVTSTATNAGTRTNITTTIEVIAPATLPAGYQFPVSLSGQGTFVVVVPEGGVTVGQRFLAVIQQPNKQNPTHFNSHANNNLIVIPEGAWRDNLCDCCNLGWCHPTLCWSFWCVPLALGQVMTRMKLTICGMIRRTEYQVRRTPFHIMAFIVALYVLTEYSFSFTRRIYNYNDDDVVNGANDNNGTQPGWVHAIQIILTLIHIAYWILLVLGLTRTRMVVRDVSHIPERYCHQCEDCCCAVWCGCCTAAQMLRHTADYRYQRSSCFSSTGLDV